MSLNLPPTTETVHLFLYGGQSNCVGKAKIDRLLEDDNYSDYHKEQSGVWFAGRSDDTDDFVIGPMTPGLENGSRGTFGAQVSMGYHYHRVTNKHVMIVKLGAGGTNVYQDWNPYTVQNQWDRDKDDGTAAYLIPNYGSDQYMYKNFVHNSRLVMETLKAANVSW